MRQILLLFIIGFFSASVRAQEAINCVFTSEVQEEALFYQIDRLPTNLRLGQEGTGNIWNFIDLKAPLVYSFQYSTSDRGSHFEVFRESDYVFSDPWGGEKYLERVGEKIAIQGEVQILGEMAKHGSITKTYQRPLTIWNDRLELGHVSLSGGFWTTEIDQSVLALLGIDEERVRLEVAEELEEIIDAEGFLYLPASYHDAMRIYRQRSRDIVAFVLKDDTWVPADRSALSTLKEFIRPSSSEYIYVNRENKDVLAQIVLRPDASVDHVIFKTTEENTTRKFNLSGNLDFVLYPSTSDGNVRLDFMNFQKGQYRLVIYNIVGSEIWQNSYDVTGDVTLKEDLSFLPKGTYIYSLVDHQMNNLFTRRLAIINP